MGLLTFTLSMGSGPRSSRDFQVPPLEEDCSYLANLFGSALEEELATLSQYTQCAFVTLALGEIGRWEALWSD